MSEDKLKKYQFEIRKRLEPIEFKLTKESLESITKAIVNVYTEEFRKFTKDDGIEFKRFKDFMDNKIDSPWRHSDDDFEAFWLMTLQPALISEMVYKMTYNLRSMLDFKAIKNQVYKNMFKMMK